MNTPNSNDNGLNSSVEGDQVQSQGDTPEFNSREGDYSNGGLCPQCFNPVETDCDELVQNIQGDTINECADYCPKCGWFSVTYYED